jgi:hypothetical protein
MIGLQNLPNSTLLSLPSFTNYPHATTATLRSVCRQLRDLFDGDKRRRIPFTKTGINILQRRLHAGSLRFLVQLVFDGTSLFTLASDIWSVSRESNELLAIGKWTDTLRAVSLYLVNLRSLVLFPPDPFAAVKLSFHDDSRSDWEGVIAMWHWSVSQVLCGLSPNLASLTDLRIATWINTATIQDPTFLPLTSVHYVFNNIINYSALRELSLGLESAVGMEYHRSKQ